tara:strand:- start:1430 stop:1801 length:372 start_codon:yes stop_codon:yes gene_type:complete
MNTDSRFQLAPETMILPKRNDSKPDPNFWLSKDIDDYSFYRHFIEPSSNPFKPIEPKDEDEDENGPIGGADYIDYYLEINHEDIENLDSFTDDEDNEDYEAYIDGPSDSDSGDEVNDWMFERY